MLFQILFYVTIIHQCYSRKSKGKGSGSTGGGEDGCPNYGASCAIENVAQSSCQYKTLQCPSDNDYCYIECNDKYACAGATIIPPSNAVLDLSCQNSFACQGVTIDCSNNAQCNLWLHCDPGNSMVCSKTGACSGLTIIWSSGRKNYENKCDCLGDCLNDGGNSDGNYENCPNWDSAFVFHHEGETPNEEALNVYTIICIMVVCVCIAAVGIGCFCYRKKKKIGDNIQEIGDESEEEEIEEGNAQETATIDVEIEVEAEEDAML